MDDLIAALPSLVVITGAEAGRRIPLTTGPATLVGRALQADLTFPDEPSLADLHVRIERYEGRYTLTPLHGSAGTWLNDRPVSETTPLADGDVIRCGVLLLRFELPSAGADPTRLPPQDDDGDAAATPPRIRAIIANDSRSTPPSAAERESTPSSADASTDDEGAAAGTFDAAIGIVPLFRPLDAAQRALLARRMTGRTYAPGDEIVRQGEEGLSLFVILDGEVQVVRASGSGEEVEIARIGAGGFFGEMTVLDGLPRSATVRALTEVRCALLPRWELVRVIRDHPTVALELLAVLSDRLRATQRLLVD
jgi:hypothetical protein